jgi:hypothetical protein
MEAASAEAARAQDQEGKLQELRNERQRLGEDIKRKDAALVASKKCVLQGEEQVQNERDRMRQERDKEVAQFRRQIQEIEELRKADVGALRQQLAAAQATAKADAAEQVARLESETAALRTQLQEAREQAKASVRDLEQLQAQLKAQRASLETKEKEANALKEAARQRTQQSCVERQQMEQELKAAQAKFSHASALETDLKDALREEKARFNALELSFRELQDEKADKEAEAMTVRDEVDCFRRAEGKNAKELANCIRLLDNAQQAEAQLRRELQEMKEAHEKALASTGALLLAQEDLENARAEVADLRAQLAMLKQDASARESQAAQDASIGESVHEHTRDLCLILGFLITRVEDALATPWGTSVECAKDADDDVPELIRRISSRAGLRNPALLREASSLSAFSSASVSDSQTTTPVPAAEGSRSPGVPAMAVRSLSEAFRAPAALPSGNATPDAGTDLTPPGLCDVTSEAVAALHNVIALISKMKEMSKEEHHTSESYLTVKDELQIVEDSRDQLKVGLTCLVQPSLAPKT